MWFLKGMSERVFFSCDWEYLEFYFLIAHISASIYYKILYFTLFVRFHILSFKNVLYF